MLIHDVMHQVGRAARPEQTILDAAAVMEEADIGCLPVVSNGRPVGLLTIRDIARHGPGAATAQVRVGEVMSANVRCCREDEDIDDVLAVMFRDNIHLVPVLDRRGQTLVGVVSLVDLAANALENKFVGMILAEGAPAPDAVN